MLKTSSEQLDQAVQIVLLLSWRWRLPELAGRIFHRFAKAKEKATSVLNWAIMASSAHENAADQMTMLENLALGVGLSAPATLKPFPLFRSLSAIANAAPELAGALSKAKLAAALAI